jgi:hypothetical protein
MLNTNKDLSTLLPSTASNSSSDTLSSSNKDGSLGRMNAANNAGGSGKISQNGLRPLSNNRMTKNTAFSNRITQSSSPTTTATFPNQTQMM